MPKLLNNKIKSKRFDFATVAEINGDFVNSNFKTIIKKYFSKEYAETNFKVKEIWKEVSKDEIKAKMILGESLLHFAIEENGDTPLFGKGYEIRTSNLIPNSYDAFAINNSCFILGESKYIKNKSGNVSAQIEDYKKGLERSENKKDVQIVKTTLDDFDFSKEKEIKTKLFIFGVYGEDKENNVEYLENRLAEMAKNKELNQDIIYEWVLIKNSVFDNLVLKLQEFWSDQ